MQRACDHCGGSYEAKSANSKFCTRAECRRERERDRKRGGQVVPLPPGPAGVGSVTTAAVAALTAADRLESPAGAAAVVLARRLDANGDSGAAVAAMTRELRAAMTEAMAGVPPAADRVDELREQREKRRRASSGAG